MPPGSPRRCRWDYWLATAPPFLINETAGPSDGLLFVASALNMPSTTNILAKSVIHQHHKGLISSDEGRKMGRDLPGSGLSPDNQSGSLQGLPKL